MARPAGIAIGAAGKTTSKREGALFASWSAFRAASERSLGGDTRPFYAPPSRAAPLPLVMHSHACLRSFRSVSSHATSHRLAHSVHNGCQQCRWVGTQDHGMRRRRAPHRWLLWCILMRAFARFAPSRRMPPIIAPRTRCAPVVLTATYTLPRPRAAIMTLRPTFSPAAPDVTRGRWHALGDDTQATRLSWYSMTLSQRPQRRFPMSPSSAEGASCPRRTAGPWAPQSPATSTPRTWSATADTPPLTDKQMPC